MYSASAIFPFPNDLQVSVDQISDLVFPELIYLNVNSLTFNQVA